MLVKLMKKRHSRAFIALFLVVGFSLASMVGAHLMATASEDGTMRNCPIMSGLSQMCDINAVSHVSSWRQFFFATFERSALFSMLAAFALISALFIFGLTDFLPSIHDKSRERYGGINFKNYLLEIIGSGIVHKRE